MSVPNSVIHILSGVPINNSYEHSLWFANAQEQYAYFYSKRFTTLSKYTYLRPERKIKVAGLMEDAHSWNYIMFQNSDGKWFYHFINKVEYIGENTVELEIELDVIQTYMFDWNMHQCFVERTHTRTDEIGEHTIPEGLETGPLVDRSVDYINMEDLCIMVLMAMDGDGNSAYAKMYDGVFSGLAIKAVMVSKHAEFGEWLDAQSEAGKIDAVVSMWMYPRELLVIQDTWESDALLMSPAQNLG